MAYEKKTIAAIIDQIDAKKIYLPAIQRKFVWTEDQIVHLMDSIMRGYPFGTFLFWKVKKKIVNDNNYTMYEFIKDYHERDKYKNETAGQPFNVNDTNLDESILSVLDGQQRLTSLYIALKGSISLKLAKKHWNNDDAFPKKELYFDLHSKGVPDENSLADEFSEDDDIVYSFKFLTEEEASNTEDGKLWYKTKEIIQYPDLKSINKMLRNHGWDCDDRACDNAALLFQKIKTEELINFFEVESDSIDAVLDIFVRTNKGGTVLSKTDLLFSTLVSYWDSGREQIDNLLTTINKIGDHYAFTSDFIMKSCLYVLDISCSLSLKSFGVENVERIKNAWINISDAIKDTVYLLDELGFNADNIVATNAIVPIIYYRYNYGVKAFDDKIDPITKKIVLYEKEEIRKYLVISQLRRIFGQSTNTALGSIQKVLEKHKNEKFELSLLQDLTIRDRDLRLTEEDLESWFDIEKDAFTFMLLSLLYPNLKYNQNGFHQDHMHPYASFEQEKELKDLVLPNNEKMSENKIKEWRHKRNTLANLQLLEGRENEIKKDIPLKEWLKNDSNRENVKYLPKVNYDLSNFDLFFEERKKLMLAQLRSILL